MLVHIPREQTWFIPQLTPQVPQLRGSASTPTQRPPQSISPVAQPPPHSPLVHVWPVGHAAPHAPQ